LAEQNLKNLIKFSDKNGEACFFQLQEVISYLTLVLSTSGIRKAGPPTSTTFCSPHKPILCIQIIM